METWFFSVQVVDWESRKIGETEPVRQNDLDLGLSPILLCRQFNLDPLYQVAVSARVVQVVRVYHIQSLEIEWETTIDVL